MDAPFDVYITTPAASFKYALGASVLSGNEFHLCYELVLFLDGEANLISETANCRLTPHTLVVIPKEKYHCFAFTGNPDAYYRCVINFYDTPYYKSLIGDALTEIQVISAVPAPILAHFQRLIEKSQSTLPTPQKEQLLTAILTEILVDICQYGKRETPSAHHPVTTAALAFIHREFQRPLTVGEIAAHCHVSQSALAHSFQQDLHTSVYRYLLNKRLITAQKQIVAGTPPLQAAAQCGFNDYSGFFRAYKRYFGNAPLQDKR